LSCRFRIIFSEQAEIQIRLALRIKLCKVCFVNIRLDGFAQILMGC
jgi:hypothetical protein